MDLLLEEKRRELERDEEARREILRALRAAPAREAPGAVAWVYGSVTSPGGFNRYSDLDVAFESLPRDASLYALQSLLSAACGREVDVCFLHETRLEEKIRREGERWTV
ncbi:MAG: nucleotidyltransferase domain-containing protein [Akkermansiaceae bacterium]|nr:nucleotidyltransferase domain-containing protein [Akkermansiaceae bacterium]